MNDMFRELFYSTKNKGLIGFQELYRLAKPLNPKVTLKLAKEFVDAQENTQIFKEPRRDLFNPIVAPDHSYQCDLLFIRDGGKLNPVFVMMEITTRMGFLRAMKDKTAESTAAALQSILDTEQPEIKALEHDDGKEFKGAFEELLQAKNITDVTFPRLENSKTSLGKVERFNLTIRRFWNRSFRGRVRVSEAIPEIQEFYNGRKHSATNRAPEQTTAPEQIAKVRAMDVIRGSEARNNIRKDFKKGVQVRLREDTDVFKKKSEAKWRRKIHTITAVDGVNFQVSDAEDRNYRAWEMLPLKAVQTEPERPRLPPEPKPVRAGIRKLQKEIEKENIVTAPRERLKPPVPKQAPKPPPKPAAKPKKENVFTLRRVDGHEFKKVKGKLKLFFKVDYHIVENGVEKPTLYPIQPAENFWSDEGINPLIKKYVASIKAKDSSEWLRLEKYIYENHKTKKDIKAPAPAPARKPKRNPLETTLNVELPTTRLRPRK